MIFDIIISVLFLVLVGYWLNMIRLFKKALRKWSAEWDENLDEIQKTKSLMLAELNVWRAQRRHLENEIRANAGKGSYYEDRRQ